MSNNEIQNTKKIDPFDWIEDAIDKEHLNYYKYKDFDDIQEIDTGGFATVSRANWKNIQRFALKIFKHELDEAKAEEIVREIKLHRKVDFHRNIIRFHGITKSNPETKTYVLVMEYADGDTLRNCLKKNFDNFTWDDKYRLAHQLANAVLCLHIRGIVHRDLHSRNVLVHQNVIKLADFGLSKRIEEVSNSQSDLFGMASYIDPKKLASQQTYSLNEKSDVYSVGVLLWEISSGKPPFDNRKHDLKFILEILGDNLREKPVPGTPDDYIKLYTECWNSEPKNRPTMNNVVQRLKICQQQKTLIAMVSKIIVSITDELNKGTDCNETRTSILNYLNDDINDINSQKFYDWLSKNQNSSSSIFLLGYFNYLGIGTAENNEKALDLFIEASKKDHTLAQYFAGNCYEHGTKKNKKSAFEWFEKAAKKNFIAGQNKLGYCYEKEIGTKKDINMAVKWYEKAADNGNILALHNLGLLYQGNSVDIARKAIMLGYCYNNGIETNINKKKAVELYKKAANLGHNVAQYNLAIMYEKGDGIDKDIGKATFWYEKSEQDAKTQLKELTILKKFLIKVVSEIVSRIIRELNEGIDCNVIKQHILNYLNDDANIIDSKEFYDLLLNNQYNSDSICLLGYFNYFGIGTAENNNEAFRLFENASNQDHKLAQYSVGVCFQDEHGIEKNEKLAFDNFKKVANKGFIAGQNRLGYCYEKGIGTKKNIIAAVHWYEKASINGNIAATYNLGLLYKDGGEGVDKNYQEAFKLFKKSAERRHLRGIMMLGYCYKNGIGTKIDKQGAIELYKEAADLGNDVAQYNLAMMYEKGDGIKKDTKQAIHWYRKSANQGHVDSENILKTKYSTI